MKASIAGRIRNTHLPKAKALLPLFEAVMNSFQAIEEAGGAGHRIQIIGERAGDIEGDRAGAFVAFSIIDTGSGFNDDNLDSFETVDSPYKAMRGGKGLGRFLWLKAFQRVEVTSHYRAIGKAGLLRRSFAFTANDEPLDAAPSQSDRKAPETTVRLSGFLSPYVNECPRPLDAIAQRLIVHFLPLFLHRTGPAISVSDGVDTLDLRAFFSENFAQLSTRQTLTVAGETFTLDAFRLHGALADHHGLIFAADYREVLAERLAKHLPNLKNRLIEEDGAGFYYLAFIQGAFLDTKANSERTDFAIPKDGGTKAAVEAERDDEESSLFDGEITLKMIRDEAIKAVSADLRPFLDELNMQKQAALVSFIDEDAPQYRVLLKYSEEFIDDIAPHASRTDIELALHKQLYQREVRLKQEGVKILKETATAENADEYYARLQRFVEDENEIGKTSLAKYVVHRRVILELLDKYLSRDQATGDYGLEKTIHSLVFPMRSTSGDVPFEQQNLWIIDERLTFHTFLSSDIPFNKTPLLENSSASRPDLLIFNQPLAFSEDGEPLQSMVIVEFKKPDRTNYHDEDPISQVYRLVREIRDGKKKNNQGRLIRPATDKVPAYCYIICDLTSPVETRIQNMGARRTPDNLGYYGYNETLNAYFEIISYTKLLADAQKRNRVLFDKLNLPTRSDR